MKIKYYFFLAFKSLKGKKINILNILLLTISMTIIVAVLTFSKTIDLAIERDINGNIRQKTIIVYNLEDGSSFSKLDNVSYVSNLEFYYLPLETPNSEEINIIGVPDDYIEVVSGITLNETEESNALICPQKFYLGSNNDAYNEEYFNKLKDGDKFLNTKMTLMYIDKRDEYNPITIYNEEYKIIGTYINEKYTYGKFNNCFTTIENIKKIYSTLVEYQKDICINSNKYINCDDVGEVNSTIVVVKDVEKIDDTLKKIESMGYVANKMVETNTTGINFIKAVTTLIAIVTTFITFIILLISNNKFIIYNMKNNIIYKALGYDNKTLIKVNYLEFALLTLISFVLSIIMVFILSYIYSRIYIVDTTYLTPISFSISSFLFSLIIAIIVSTLAIYISLKKNNNSIVEELSDGEI